MHNSYAAGLIDGEGYIGISHVKAANTYAIRVQISMVTKGTPVLEVLRANHGGRIRTREGQTEQNAPQDAWVVDGEAAAAFLEKVRPYLILKGSQADCALDLWASIEASRMERGRFHWNDDLRRHARHLMLRVQELNARGPERAAPDLPNGDPIAVYRWGEWWNPTEDLFGPTPFRGKLPTCGRMVAGRIYAAEPPTPDDLMPTPRASRGASSTETVRMLPSPRTSDTNGAGEHGDGGLDLRTAVALLPTPSKVDGDGGRHNADGHQTTLPGVAREFPLLPTPACNNMGAADRWAEYGPAIRRWESLTRPAPEPTKPNAKGNPKLSDDFDEWLMGFPKGWITDVPGVTWNQTLKACGNGVVWQQGAAALRYLLALGEAA